ncbi:unnamed protein product, partial [Urochloa humidicola]
HQRPRRRRAPPHPRPGAVVPNAARACAVSRRWCGLWARVPALRFASSGPSSSAAEPCAALERYISFVNDILARRMQSDCPVESLEISYTTDSEDSLKQLMSVSVEAAQGWIQYAFQHGLKSIIVDLDLPDDEYEENYNDESTTKSPSHRPFARKDRCCRCRCSSPWPPRVIRKLPARVCKSCACTRFGFLIPVRSCVSKPTCSRSCG